MLLRDTHGQRITYREIVIGELVRRDGAVCNICKGPIDTMSDVETDHIVPLRLNGSNDLNNLQLTHKSCHRKKDRDLMKSHRIKSNPPKARVVRKQLSPWKLEAQKAIREKIDHYIKEGKSIVSIAKILEISRPTVYDFLSRADLDQ